MSYCWWQKNRCDGDVTCPSAAFIEFTTEHACLYKGLFGWGTSYVGISYPAIVYPPLVWDKTNATISG